MGDSTSETQGAQSTAANTDPSVLGTVISTIGTFFKEVIADGPKNPYSWLDPETPSRHFQAQTGIMRSEEVQAAGAEARDVNQCATSEAKTGAGESKGGE